MLNHRVQVTTHQFMLLLHLVDLFCVFLVNLFELSHHTLTVLIQGLFVIDQLRTRDRLLSIYCMSCVVSQNFRNVVEWLKTLGYQI